jgi:fibronectin type 3 domain-containing protein
LSVAATDATPLSYQWYEGASGDTSNPIAGATSSSYTTPVLTQTTSYWVRVNNSCGSYADSDPAIITMAGSCTAPNITSQPQSQTIQNGQTATMSVGASGTAPFSYQWYRGSSGDTSNPISSATSSNYTTPALTQTTSYWVRVNNTCGSADSNTATITITVIPTGPPSPPTNLSASDGTYLDRVEVKWAASTGATSYTVYRATSLNSWAAKTVLGTTSGTSFDDRAAVPKTTYYYYVKASNTSGTSNFSSYDAGYRSDGTPPAPTNVSVSDGTYLDKVEVTWTASSGADSYTVYRATKLRRRARKTVLGTTSATFFNDTTAVPKTTYYYYVKASNTYGTSNFSAYDAGYRSDGSPPIPTNVLASDGTYTDRVEVSWAASSGATSYTVYRATSTANWARKTVLGTTSATSFNDTTAATGRTYYYWIKASNTYGTSNFSAYDAGYR